MRKVQVWLTLLLLVAWGRPMLAEEPRIGNHALVVEGTQTFPAEQIALALATDIEIAHAASREASLERLEALLIDKATQGYLNDGFADVKVDAHRDGDGGLVVRVVEGPRFVAGKIAIRGTSTIDAAELSDNWPIDKPARLSSVKQEQLRKRTKSLLEDHGFYRSQFSIEHALDRDQRQANLIVNVSELGDPLRLDAVEVAGDERLTLAVVLDYLGLDASAVLTKEVKARIEEGLRSSGRFLSVRVEDPGSGDTDKPARVRIALAPYDKAPALNETLSREQAALVKFAAWAQTCDEGGDDFALKMKLDAVEGEVVGSPRFGMLGWIRGLPAGDKPIGPAPFDLAIVESEDEVGLYSFRRGRRLTAAPVPARFIAKMEVTMANGPPKLDGCGQLLFGASMKTYSKQDKRHCKFRVKQTAVGALSLTCQDDSVFHWDGDLLAVTASSKRLVIDSRTGRLVEHSDADADTETGNFVKIFADPDEFQRQLQAVMAAGRDLPNDADGDRPLSCMVEYATRELEYWATGDQTSALARAIRKIVEHGACERADRWLTDPARDAENDFAIPRGAIALESVSPANLAKFLARAWGIEIGDRLAPRDSWLWKFWRETMYLSAQMPSRLDHAPDYLAASQAGPIESWLAAVLFDEIGRDADSRQCAKIGLEQVNADSFRREYEAVLAEGCWSGDALQGLMSMLRVLTDDEARALAGGMESYGHGDESITKWIVEVAKMSRERHDESLTRVTRDALDLLWRDCLKQRLQDALEKLATEPTPKPDLQRLLNQINSKSSN